MKLLNNSRADRDVFGDLMNKVQRVSVAGDLLFGTVSRRGGLEDQRLDSLVGSDDALDPVRGLARFDERYSLERP
jgi:hypothetical protein